MAIIAVLEYFDLITIFFSLPHSFAIHLLVCLPATDLYLDISVAMAFGYESQKTENASARIVIEELSNFQPIHFPHYKSIYKLLFCTMSNH